MTGPAASSPESVNIASDSSLQELLRRARSAGRIALDTEFMGEGRYRTLLCLIQLASPPTPGGEDALVELVDPLAADVDLLPLAALLGDPRIEVVVHSGRQDIALLRRHLGSEISGIFDTQVAAGFVGMPAQGSYESLLLGLLDIRIAKSASFTRWDARPLSSEQLRYAREDVVHLLELAGELERRLQTLGRLQWAREECEPLQESSDARDPDVIFARLPRVRGLAPAAQAVARELVSWREHTAERKNRPVQSIVHDAVLVEIAKRRPSSSSQLAEIRGVGEGLLRRLAPEILRTVAEADELPHETLERGSPPNQPEPGDAPLVALCEAFVRARSREVGLAYELLATRAELQAIVAARRSDSTQGQVRTVRGWRRELLGEDLLALLDGRISLSVLEGRLHVGERAP